MSDTEEPTVASGTGDLPSCEPSYVMPEWHDVVMRGETDEEVILRVHVTKATAPKKYLGGYRHKTTGVTYHHASSQTVERSLIPPRRNVECLRHRDTQTQVAPSLCRLNNTRARILHSRCFFVGTIQSHDLTKAFGNLEHR